MKQRKKVRDGITLYLQTGQKAHTEPGQKHSFLLSAVQVLTVWFLAFSWWQSLTSVFPVRTDTPRMYLSCFFFATFLVSIWNARLHAAIKGLILEILAGIGGFFIWSHLDGAVNVLNFTANAYLTVCRPEANPYPIQPVPAMQMAVMFAVFQIPLLLVWSFTLHIRRGRMLGLILLLSPAAFALIVAQVPSETSCWLVLLSGAVYLAVCGCREGRSALAKGISCACILAFLIFLSAFGSRPLEQYKEPADGFYAHTRESIETQWIVPLQESYALAKAEREAAREPDRQNQEMEREDSTEPENGDDPEDNPEPESEDASGDNTDLENGDEADENTALEGDNSGEQADPGQDSDGGQDGQDIYRPSTRSEGNLPVEFSVETENGGGSGLPAGNGPFSGNGGEPDSFPDMGALSYFQPDSGRRLTLTLDSKPGETVYYPGLYGEYYDRSRWNKVHSNSELPSTIYLQYPDNLTRLKQFCGEEAPGTLAEASDFIQREFEENTVYDFEPGPTPDGEDFAEYFLFENKKGFCVHFATTAVLMYRMCGYPARYVQGYAVPPSAFHRQEDGSYAAEVTGEMGHAWCEVSEDGEWILKEHTLPYHGARPENGIPAASESGRSWTRNAVGWGLLIVDIFTAGAVCLLALFLLFFAQAAIRRQRKYQRFRRVRQGLGIQRMYRAVYDMAVFQGMEDADILSVQGFRQLRDSFPEIPPEDMEWLYHTVMETMFYQKTATREDTRRAWKLYVQFSRMIKKKLSPSKRWVCNYIKVM